MIISLVSFKVIYAIWRGKTLEEHGKALLMTEVHRKQMHLEFPRGEPHYGHEGYQRYRDLDRQRGDLDKEAKKKGDNVRNNSDLSLSLFASALWPFALVALTGWGLWHAFKFTFFRKGLDKAARERADRALAKLRTEQDERERAQQIIQLGLKELEES
jgi:hypothetical protein